jgi:outer membrane lipoprotein LolB
MRALSLAAALLVAACAQLQTAPSEKPVFELAARLAARQGGEAFTGNLAWRHAAASDELLITNSLGQGIARIVRGSDGVVLTTAEPKEYRGADVESISEQALGYRLPLAGLADWVQGRPSARLPEARVEKADDGRIQRLQQGGWTIEYLEHAGGRPKRLRLQYPGGIDLRLAISEWK